MKINIDEFFASRDIPEIPFIIDQDGLKYQTSTTLAVEAIKSATGRIKKEIEAILWYVDKQDVDILKILHFEALAMFRNSKECRKKYFKKVQPG